MRTSEHRTCTYVYDDVDTLVGSVEWEPHVCDTPRHWAVYIWNSNTTGKMVARTVDRGAGLIALGMEFTRRSMAKIVVEVDTK